LEQLKASMRDQRAIAHAVEQLGEAAGRVSEAFQQRHPEIPWRQIVGARNRLAHEYERIDWSIIWKILQESIPTLLESLDKLIPPTPGDPPSEAGPSRDVI
ncbi:MAG TPA: HepT-like ribonuclease domain-containing protein, partial [Longimicrobiaceae bacterium]